MATTANPEQILRDLKNLWSQLAQEADAGGVLKACALTLVVVPEDDADAENVRRTVGVLMHDHPSRAIVVRPDAGGDFDARVFAECWKPFGKNQQICAEGIEVSAGAGDLQEVARFVVPLRVPDLPLVLWCRGAEPFTVAGAQRLAPLFDIADKLIFDSKRVPDAPKALDFLRQLRSPVRRVADLHWARLSGWREVLAHLFDDQAMKPKQVISANIGYAGQDISTCALYAASWIRTAVPHATVAVNQNTGLPGLNSIVLEATGKSLRLERIDGCVQVDGCGRSYRSSLPASSEETLMREELRILGFDPIWERVLTA